jgi:hypothetical protein
LTSVWPDVAAATSPGLKVRDQLDYLAWIADAVEPLGFHVATEVASWRGRIHRAYAALVDSMSPGHGDSLPPDVPPAVQPGTWPDVAAGTIPGMTIRHQLAVIRRIAVHTRSDRTFPRTPAEIATWTQRIQTAYDAIDHGPSMPVPSTARTEPPPPPPPAPKRRPTSSSRGARAGSKASAGGPAERSAPKPATQPAATAGVRAHSKAAPKPSAAPRHAASAAKKPAGAKPGKSAKKAK